MSSPAPPAGWYADPNDASLVRYWDGAAWSEHSAPARPEEGPLWKAGYLVLRTKARVGSWLATVHDQAMAQIGTMEQQGNDVHLFDSGRRTQLIVDVGPQLVAQFGSLTFEVRRAGGQAAGRLEPVEYFNRRVTLSAQVDGQELAVLKPNGDTDGDFLVTDPAGAQVGRVWRAERDRSLTKEDETWIAQLQRPLPQPLDTMALATIVGLDPIQHRIETHRRRDSFD